MHIDTSMCMHAYTKYRTCTVRVPIYTHTGQKMGPDLPLLCANCLSANLEQESFTQATRRLAVNLTLRNAAPERHIARRLCIQSTIVFNTIKVITLV